MTSSKLSTQAFDGWALGAADALAELSALEVLDIQQDNGQFILAALWSLASLASLRQLTLHGNVGNSETEAGIERAMWHLVFHKHSLTRLAFGVTEGVTAPTLCGVLGRMTALHHLELLGSYMDDVLAEPLILTELLQPLPPHLRVLHFRRCTPPPPFVEGVLKPMAELHKCVIRVTSDDVDSWA